MYRVMIWALHLKDPSDYISRTDLQRGGGNRGINYKSTEIMHARKDGGLDQGRFRKSVEKWSYSKYILKARSIVLSYRFDLACKTKAERSGH